MNCKKCHAIIPDDSAFCPECGEAVTREKDASAYFSMGGDIGAPDNVPTPDTAPISNTTPTPKAAPTLQAAPALQTPEPAGRKFCPFCGNVLPMDARFCSRCTRNLSTGAPAAHVPSATPKARPTGYKRHLRWIIPVAAVLMLILVYAGIRSAAPWSSLRSDGTFTVNERMWELFCNPFHADNVALEIPREYDREIKKFSGKQRDFSYDGTLEQLITNHPWVFQLGFPESNHNYAQVKCKDYTVKFNYSGLGAVDNLWWAPNRFMNYSCDVIRKDGKHLPFQSLEDMFLWVQEGVYHQSWSNGGLFGDWSTHDEYIDSEDVEFID